MAALISNQQAQLRLLTDNLLEMKETQVEMKETQVEMQERLDLIDSDTGTQIPTAQVSDFLSYFLYCVFIIVYQWVGKHKVHPHIPHPNH